MLHLVEKVISASASAATLTLDFEQRSRSRLRATLDDGREVAITLQRGAQLLPGDALQADSGEVVRVNAADETVSVVNCNDAHLLARACYHLGNRHVALQIAPGQIRYLHDHVLDDMLALLGLLVEVKRVTFEPESGAYGAHAHIHDHAH